VPVVAGISSLLLAGLVLFAWPVEPARLRAAPLLSFDQGGSIALETAAQRRVEFRLPRSMAYFASAEEAASVGAEAELAPATLAAHLQAQLRAAAEGDPELSGARVVVAETEEGRPALEFISGPVPEGARWRFVCPGQALGPGPSAPLRTGKGGRALCASKYASPLVAALGAHPSLEGARAQASTRAAWPLGWGLLGLSLLGLLIAGTLAWTRRGG
jgi:hypothetical protein